MGEKHTPGPWTVEDPLGPETLWIVEGGKEPHEWRCIAMVCRDDLDDHNDLDLPIGAGEQQANARLIAAAPELLAEVKEFRRTVAYYIEIERKNGKDSEGVRLKRIKLRMLDELIAKVEGR